MLFRLFRFLVVISLGLYFSNIPATFAQNGPHGSPEDPQRSSGWPVIIYHGVEITRLTSPPIPRTDEQSQRLRMLYSSVVDQARVLGLGNPRSAEALAEVMANPGHPLPLADVIIIRPQDFNLTPSAASLYRLAQRARVVIVAYHGYSADHELYRLRDLEQVDDVTLPFELRGRILQIGHHDRADMIPFDKESDDFLEALEGIRQQLPQRANGLDLSSASTDVLVMAHGASVFDSVLTRKRLDQAADAERRAGRPGFANPIKRLIAFAAPDMTRFEAPAPVQWFQQIPRRIREYFGGPDFATALEALSRREVRRYLNPEDMHRYVDLSVAGTILPEGRAQRSQANRVQRRQYLGLSPAFPLVSIAAEIFARFGGGGDSRGFIERLQDFVMDPFGLDGARGSNGIVALHETQYGQDHFYLSGSTDHNRMWADANVMEQLGAHLRPTPDESGNILRRGFLPVAASDGRVLQAHHIESGPEVDDVYVFSAGFSFNYRQWMPLVSWLFRNEPATRVYFADVRTAEVIPGQSGYVLERGERNNIEIAFDDYHGQFEVIYARERQRNPRVRVHLIGYSLGSLRILRELGRERFQAEHPGVDATLNMGCKYMDGTPFGVADRLISAAGSILGRVGVGTIRPPTDFLIQIALRMTMRRSALADAHVFDELAAQGFSRMDLELYGDLVYRSTHHRGIREINLSNVHTPLHFVVGAEDPIFTPDAVRRTVAELPMDTPAEISIIRGLGHGDLPALDPSGINLNPVGGSVPIRSLGQHIIGVQQGHQRERRSLRSPLVRSEQIYEPCRAALRDP